MKKTIQLLAGLGLALSGQAYAETGSGTGVGWGALNLPQGVTETSHDIHDLHMLIMWICVGIGVLVYGVLVYSLIHHRKSKGVVPATFRENHKLEIVWTIIPFLILLAMAIPATKVMMKVYDTGESTMTIKITGYQWKWRYEYQKDDEFQSAGINFFSMLDAKSNEARQLGAKLDPSTVPHYLLNVDKPLVIPANRKIRILLTGADVIHAWWVPEFGWKKDAIPGFMTDGWIKVEKPGIYRGQCAELCGRDHGFMPIVVIVKSDEEYKQWVAEQKGTQQAATPDLSKPMSLDELNAKGKEVYASMCAGCHQAGGEGMGSFPAIKGSKVAQGPLADHVKLVLKGKAAMPAFAEQLNDVELAAVVTYQRNGFGNNKGDSVQPAEIQTYK